MGRRRNEDLVTLLSLLPWWVSIALAVAVYVSCKWILPVAWSSNAVLSALGKGIGANAGVFASIFLATAAVSAVADWYRRRLLDSQSSLQSIKALSWQDFERLVGEAFRRKGYSIEENGGGGADGGIDLVLRKDGVRTLVQCKRWRERQVGVSAVREPYGVMMAEKADSALFVTSGKFTEDAKHFAKDLPMGLINGEALNELVHSVRVHGRTSDGETAHEAAAPKCP